VAVDIQVYDLLPFAPSIDPEQAVELIAGTLARAAEYAPCILDVDFDSSAAAKDIIRAGILRRYEAGGGIITTQTVGSVSIRIDNSKLNGGLFTDAEISELQRMCRESGLAIAPTARYGMPDPPDSWPEPAEIVWTSG
jgi:hypothetical protein